MTDRLLVVTLFGFLMWTSGKARSRRRGSAGGSWAQVRLVPYPGSLRPRSCEPSGLASMACAIGQPAGW